MSSASASAALVFPAHDAIAAALPHPILVIDPNGRAIYANSAAEHFFSIGHSLLKRQTLTELAGATSPLVSLVEQVRRNGATVNEYGIELTIQRVAGPRLVDIYGGLLNEPAQHVLVMLMQRSMAQMIERQLTHRAAARSVSGMAAMLAHEIKNPLSGIRGAAQLLEPALGSEDRALAQLIVAETDRVRHLVDRMEVFGDERPLEKAQVNIHSVLDHVKRLSESGFARGIAIVEDYDPSLPPIFANRDKLVQAILNLMKNAAEALTEQKLSSPRITLRTAFRAGVRLQVPGAQTRVSLPFMIEIEDNGAGIPLHVKDHLFDPFVTTKSSGSGLGLALVAKIVADHGGIVECESQPRQTIFRLMLPIETGSAVSGGAKKG